VPEPTATYRLQLRPSFGFAEAAAIAGHLASLGVSHVYLSPILQAVPGSEHGYDVLDHTRISADLGGEEGFRAMAGAFREHGLGIVVDIVPNHMALPNPLADSVLELGSASPYASFFDIDGERPVMPGQGEPNYRRFFEISGLIALRQEEPEVFEHTHALILRLVGEGLIQGLRVDHPDGLTDPAGYFRKLAERAPGAWIVAEKILAPDERLPRDWPVAGTTGYDALRLTGGIFLDPAGERPLTDLFQRLTAGPDALGPVEDAAKRHVLDHGLSPELRRLTRALPGQAALSGQAVFPGQAAEVLTELLVPLPVYRAYVVPGEEPSPETRAIIEAVRAKAAERLPGVPLDEVVSALLGGDAEFAVRFQQTSSALAAKGVEDTAFYRWPRFAALNEVGGDPARFGLSVDAFHAECARLAADWPATMTTLGTHDTKRQEDVRARLAVLSELPDEWASTVEAWRGAGTPLEPELEYLVWQTLVGAWPVSYERFEGYVVKSMREAKLRTSWTEPDADYEKAVLAWLRDLFADRARLAAVEEFVARLAPHARVNSLGQKLVQLTMPGIPDTYQGAELTDLSLVDPDNRRPVDFERRTELLRRLDEGHRPRDLDEEKLLVTSRALRLRRSRPGWFGQGYEPITTDPHLVAFRRGGAVTVATRLPCGLEARGGWGDLRLSAELSVEPSVGEGAWRDVLTGGVHTDGEPLVAEVLRDLPVALLVREP
jgi:(1->4)-alpha-D-glucan 1-alpha-D-glucosylmutase